MSQTVFILGAGASKGAGAPVMANFLDRADDLRRTGNAEKVKPDFDRVFDAISALQSVHSKAELDLDNVESVFAAFEMGRLINRLPGISGDEIELLLVSIRRLICKTLEKTVNYPVSDERIFPAGSYNLFAGLVDALNDSGEQKRCSIITFNYDLAIDHAFYFHTHPADYCLSETTKPGHTPLMKLHGSLNWATCSECREIIPWDIHAFFQKHTFRFLKEGKSKFVCLDLASKLPTSGLKHCEKDVEPVPVIVPPTWNKTAYHQGLSKVWNRAALELSDAENIFVSGYSLTESDSFFRYLFALGSVGETRIKRFWVFDPDKDSVLPRFQKLVGPATRARFKFEDLTFAGAIKFISDELKTNR